MKNIFKRLLNVKGMVVEDVSIDDSPLRDAPVLVARVRCRKSALRCSRCGRKYCVLASWRPLCERCFSAV